MLASQRIGEIPSPFQTKLLRNDLASTADIHVWRVNLAAEQQTGDVAENLRLLSSQEKLRANRFLAPEPRVNYIKGRGVLRCLLATYLHQHPADVRIETTKFGKPVLAAPADAWLCFNVAHSGTQLLVAIGHNRRVGVDIERVHADLDLSLLMQNHFAAAEQAEIAQLPPLDQQTAFFNCWTRKEAYLDRAVTNQANGTPAVC